MSADPCPMCMSVGLCRNCLSAGLCPKCMSVDPCPMCMSAGLCRNCLSVGLCPTFMLPDLCHKCTLADPCHSLCIKFPIGSEWLILERWQVVSCIPSRNMRKLRYSSTHSESRYVSGREGSASRSDPFIFAERTPSTD